MKTIRFSATVAALAVALLVMTISFTACYQQAPTFIAPVDEVEQTTTTEETFVTRPTVALPEARLTLDELIRIHNDEMPWSSLEGFEHEMIDDETAHFVVSDNYGVECSLDVTIDWDSEYLTEATLSYGDVSEDILTMSVQGITRISLLMALDAEE